MYHPKPVSACSSLLIGCVSAQQGVCQTLGGHRRAPSKTESSLETEEFSLALNGRQGWHGLALVESRGPQGGVSIC